MSVMRTPAKVDKVSQETAIGIMTEGAGISPKKTAGTSNVRRSIGEWEIGNAKKTEDKIPKKPQALIFSPPKKSAVVETATRSSSEANKTYVKAGQAGSSPVQGSKYKSRLTEARACVQKAHLYLDESRNIKTDIKKQVKSTVDRLYQLVKEAEEAGKGRLEGAQTTEREEEREQMQTHVEETRERGKEGEQVRELINSLKVSQGLLEESSRKMEENNKKIESLQEALEEHKIEIRDSKVSYASIVSGKREEAPKRETLHSLVVTSSKQEDTGDLVLNRVREALNAKEGGIEVEKVRKARDQKIIIGCRTEADRARVKERINRDSEYLKAEEIKNKNPLVMITGVLRCHKDEELARALRNQNKRIFEGLEEADATMEVAYRVLGRNPLTNKVVMRVAPKLWKRMTEVGTVRVDIQTLHVTDRSPLVQCSLCLGYGHGRKLCTEVQEKCSHCGGLHHRRDCADFMAGTAPSCCNCVEAKRPNTAHNAFSNDCPIRVRWDTLARATVAYC